MKPCSGCSNEQQSPSRSKDQSEREPLIKKRDTRQDSLGSEESLEISEADEMEDNYSAMEEETRGDVTAVREVMQDIMEGVEQRS